MKVGRPCAAETPNRLYLSGDHLITLLLFSQETESGWRAARSQRQELCWIPDCEQKIQQQPILLVLSSPQGRVKPPVHPKSHAPMCLCDSHFCGCFYRVSLGAQ